MALNTCLLCVKEEKKKKKEDKSLALQTKKSLFTLKYLPYKFHTLLLLISMNILCVNSI